jgi:hypothetical protein
MNVTGACVFACETQHALNKIESDKTIKGTKRNEMKSREWTKTQKKNENTLFNVT